MKSHFAEQLLDAALKKGADDAEVYISQTKSLNVEVKNLKTHNLERSNSFGYSIRVFKDKKLGFSFSTDPKKLDDVADQAIESALFSEPDEFNSLPRAGVGSDVKIYDSRIGSVSEKEAVNFALAVESAALAHDPRIKKTRNASVSFNSGNVRILNSKGVDISYSSTSCSANIMAVAEHEGENQIAWEHCSSRLLKDIDFEAVGKNAAIKATQLLGAKKARPVKGCVLFDPSVVAEFLDLFSSALSAESAQKKKSMLAGKIGEKVISDKISVKDSGLLDWKTGSRPFDAEGVPTSEKIMIEKGILKGFLHNTYTALKDGVESTGNAVRGAFTGLPTVGVTNLFLSAASPDFTRDMTDLIAMIDIGIYVTDTMGMHTANPISGDYSVGVSGLWIENGAMTFPVKEVVISGNILELFSNVALIGREIRFYGNIGTSHMLVEKIDISG